MIFHRDRNETRTLSSSFLFHFPTCFFYRSFPSLLSERSFSLSQCQENRHPCLLFPFLNTPLYLGQEDAVLLNVLCTQKPLGTLRSAERWSTSWPVLWARQEEYGWAPDWVESVWFCMSAKSMKGEGLKRSPGDSGAALYNKVPPFAPHGDPWWRGWSLLIQTGLFLQWM